MLHVLRQASTKMSSVITAQEFMATRIFCSSVLYALREIYQELIKKWDLANGDFRVTCTTIMVLSPGSYFFNLIRSHIALLNIVLFFFFRKLAAQEDKTNKPTYGFALVICQHPDGRFLLVYYEVIY